MVGGQVDDEEMYEELKGEIQAEVSEIETQLSRLAAHTINWLEESSNLINLCRQADSLFLQGNVEQKQTLVNSVASNLYLKDGNIGWDYKKPFEILIEGRESQDWLRGWDSNPRPRA